MVDSMPFSYYDVKDRDILFVCPKSNSAVNEKWATLAKDTDLFREKVGSIIYPSLSKEAARLKDFQMLRMEKKPRTYRRLCAQFLEEETNKRLIRSEQKQKHVTIIPEPLKLKNSKPVSETLPVFWNVSENVVERDPLSDLCSATTSSTNIISQEKQEEVTSVRDD